MSRLFHADNPFIRLLSTIFDLAVINFFSVLGLCGVITGGAALSASLYTQLALLDNTGPGLVKQLFRAFRQNFRQATLAWLCVVLVLAALICDVLLIHMFCLGVLRTVLLIFVYLLSFFVLGTASYLFPLIAHYDNTLREHLQNAFVLSVLYFPRTIAMVFLMLIPALLFFFLPMVFLYTLLFWLLLGIALLQLLNILLLRPVFQQLEDGKYSRK